MSENIAAPLVKLTVDISSIKPRKRNPRKGDVELIKESLEVNGQYRPIVVNKTTGEVLAGNHTLKAAKALGWKKIAATFVEASEEEAARIVLVDNRANDTAAYDEQLLVDLLKDLDSLEGTGYDSQDLNELITDLGGSLNKGNNDPDEAPSAPDKPTTKRGDIWQLGPHRVMCGDSTSSEDLAKLMDGRTAQLMHADPPYGMGKEGDGVQNDNLYNDKLDRFQMDWWKACRPHLEDNASAYIWGNAEGLWRLWFSGGLRESEAFTLRNEVVWNKASAQGMGSDSNRMYATASERCLFFMIGEQGFNINSDNYWEGWEPIRSYLEGEMEKCGGSKAWKEALGNAMGSHYFTTSQWAFPTAEAYGKLQKFGSSSDAFKADYDDLKADYDDLKAEYYSTRAYFNNTHDLMTDVWEYPIVSGDEREGHATPKPVAMMERVMRSSLPDRGICLEPFAGSGSTLMGAERAGRVCFTMELDPAYCDVIVTRWEEHTGKVAKLTVRDEAAEEAA